MSGQRLVEEMDKALGKLGEHCTEFFPEFADKIAKTKEKSGFQCLMPEITAEEAVDKWRAFRTEFPNELREMTFECI